MSNTKSFSSETSDRYALALYEIGKENNDLQKLSKNLTLVKSLYDTNTDFVSFVKNPTYLKNQQNEIVNSLSDLMKFDLNLKNFLLLLIKKSRLFYLRKIIDSFFKLLSKDKNEIDASLTSAKKLDDNEINNINTELAQALKSTIKFKYKVDESLIGGLKIQLGSLMIDTSIKNKLKKYEKTMMEQ